MFSEFDVAMMNRAIELAKDAENNQEVPVGALLVYDNQIISEASNCPISACDPTAHAEIIALRRGAKSLQNYRLLDTTLYVTLEPCIMCVGAMVHARVQRLVFGAYDLRVGAVASVFKMLDATELNHRVNYSGGLLAEACGDLLSAFFKKRR